MKFALFLLSMALCLATPFPVDSNGWIVTGLPAPQNSLLGPLIPHGNSPWLFGDLAETAVANNMAPAALAEAPALGAALPGTVSWTGGSVITTTADLRGPLTGKAWVAFAWNSIDGPGTGRALCPISSVSATSITCSENMFEPASSGVTAYLLPPPDSHGWDFNSWAAESPSVTWNYYDVCIGLYRLYYRTGITTYQTQARAYADITWQWTLDHGYRFVSPRAASMISQYYRALDGHSERFPGLYNWMVTIVRLWADPSASPAIDNREAGYALWDVALGAKTDPDTTRHAQYCSWLSQYTTTWNTVQSADGGWGEFEYALNPSYVSAPAAFTAPFVYEGAPWRIAINIKAMQAAYESLSDTSAQGCNNPTLAASTLATIKKAVTWQNAYGRDTRNRGIFYELASQSNDQATVYPAAGTVSISVGSATLTGSGTNWQTAGYCDGTHFIGLNAPRTVYKIASCSSNTAATLSVPFGLYGESSNVSGSAIATAPAASALCGGSLAAWCYNGSGDRNLTRTMCGDMGWVYGITLDAAYKAMTDECLSATLGGPTSGLTTAANIGSFVLPCSGPACDGLVNDTVAAAANCDTQPAPCVYGSYLYSNLGKNFGEAFGAPGIDNALAWSALPPSGPAPPPPPPPSPPVITSSLAASGSLGTAFTYQITASNAPSNFGASGLPAGLSITTSTGLISGTPTTPGGYSVPISATNAGGTGTATLTLTISSPPPPPAPAITSSLTTTATQGSSFTYQITASNTPTSFGAANLPTGLSVSTSSGRISGTPSVNGNFNVNISATNSGGTGGAVLAIAISNPPPPPPPPAAPVITSSLTASGTQGTTFSYQITATNTPTGFGASGLPSGLTVSASTGLVSGTPTASGNFNVTISAINAGGTGTAALSLSISGTPPPPPPQVLTCDLNGDAVVNIQDVQLMTNQVLGLAACTNNLTQTGSCNSQDIQRVVVAAQGGACKIGP